MRSIALSSLAGCFGALAAVCGKLTGLCGTLPGYWAWAGRAALYGGLLLCNVIMLTCYVRSLRRLPSLQATLMSNASNMVLTGVLGYALFAEALSARWFLGVACLMAGLALISKATASAPLPATEPQPPSKKED